MVVVKLRCNKCGHERLMTTKWLEAIGINLLPSNSKTLYNKIYKLLPRFKCSECKAKGVKFIYQRVNIDNKKNVSNSHVENILRKKEIPKSSWRKPPSSTTIFPKGIPGYTVNVSSSFQTQHDKEFGSKWSKKTCYYCNGTGANGNCFNCGGTAWEEAPF